MLKFHWQSVVSDTEPTPSVATTNPDLRIRNLLDDPRLDAAAGAGARPFAPTLSALPSRLPGGEVVQEQVAA